MALPESPIKVLLWLTLAIGLSYANALTASYQFDDYNVIANNPGVHSWVNWWNGLGNGIRPLLKFSYTLNWTMGLGVLGFHLTNLLIHLINAWLVYRLTQEFVRTQGKTEFLSNIPLFTALMFAAHPIHTEAVTYICGRSASLMALFYLAGLLAYVQGRALHNRIMLFVAVPLCFATALSVKETAITFPFVLMLWDTLRREKWQNALASQWPAWLMLAGVTVFFLCSDSYYSHMELSARFNTLHGNIATQLSAFSYLLHQWSVPLWLNIDPDLPKLSSIAETLLPLCFFLALLVLMLTCWRKRPWISFAIAWAMLQLIPLYLFLPRIDIANERQLYLASWPLLLALMFELKLLLNETRWRSVVAGLLIACITLTLSRNQVYQSEIALWEDTVAKSPNKARTHNNLGYAYLSAQRKEEARRELSVALQLDPLLYQARYNLRRLDE
jgi:hypothetical protein